ncbi:DUF2254 domain-containing protein [Psychromonas aquatilis]|uniref:DUF2254 domain-containing protein n=1 Tax=Psychromonas aquatilis TaxID=2005072 RepID=A0ABU9GQP4_9GAMM
MKLNFTKYALAIDKARTSFWFVPSIMVLSSILLAIISIYIDAFFINNMDTPLPLINQMDIDAIRSLLGIIAGAMITVTSIVFSITVVSLTLASSQFGPRLLRNFMMDKGTQLVLGAFISNFLFCILIFCAISFQSPYDFKPVLTVIITIIMTGISVGVLIYFIHHIAKSIQADVVIEDVYLELQNHIETLFPSISVPHKEAEHANSNARITVHDHQLNVISKCSGYIQTVDLEGLLTLATNKQVFIECCFKPGDFVLKGTAIAIIHADTKINKDRDAEVLALITLGAYRTPVQDPEFAVHQLVEIALRALSPGINDPYTAITCIDKLNSTLCALTKRAFPEKQYFDKEGILRLDNKVLKFEYIAEAAFTQIRQEANNNAVVTLKLLDSLSQLMYFSCNAEQQNFVIRQTKMIKEQQNKQSLAEEDLNQINHKITSILTKLSPSL